MIGLFETHGRADIAKVAEGLEFIARRQLEHHDVIVEALDVDTILGRKPQVTLIGELTHTSVQGILNPKRYQDVQDFLGIHVITTMNVQQLASPYSAVENAVGVKVQERLPDSVLAEADQIIDADMRSGSDEDDL